MAGAEWRPEGLQDPALASSYPSPENPGHLQVLSWASFSQGALRQSFPERGPWTAASASPGIWLEMQLLSPTQTPALPNQELGVVGLATWCQMV